MRSTSRQRARGSTVAAIGCLLAAPSPSAAATRDVRAGLPPTASARVSSSVDVNAFFPEETTVGVGDVVRFLPGRPRGITPVARPDWTAPRQKVGFHSYELPPRGRKKNRLVIVAGKVAERDAAGRAFWFRGFERNVLNRKLAVKTPRGIQTFNGLRRIIGGLPENDNRRTLSVRFTRPGVYRFFCNLHHQMEGKVRVVSKRRDVPSLRAHRDKVNAQVRIAVKRSRTLQAQRGPRRTVLAGQSAPGGVHRYAFRPTAMTVRRNQAVSFAIPAGSRERHTATTGPGDPAKEPLSYLGLLAGTIHQPDGNPIATYPSDPIIDAAPLTRSYHGNGFWNSGVLEAAPNLSSRQVRFTQTGSFNFFCLVHPFMRMTVRVRR